MGVERIFVSFRSGRCREGSVAARADAIVSAWLAWSSLERELAPRFALQTGWLPFVRSQGSRSMSSARSSAVLALKRNSSTVRYCFEADAEPAAGAVLARGATYISL